MSMEIPMKPWTDEDKVAWLKEQTLQRSYNEEVISRIESLRDRLEISQYGALSYNKDRYPVFLLKTKSFDPKKKTIVITGGVHGYETSGIHGAIGFMEKAVHEYTEQFNFVCAPCISP